MQIVVPMSGFGERFRRAGYRVPKPLIEVDGKPIIAHVIDLFPGETDFLFVCNQDHLDDPAFAMAEQLQRYCPTGRIAGIAPHKLGPVNAVLQAIDLIDPSKPTVVNYCDFTCVWDYPRFKRMVAEGGWDGAIPCYTGFHPHMMGSTNYAYVRTEGERVLAIQEKKPYTDQPMREYASSGTYYFASGALMRESFKRCMARPDLALNDEYYVSLAYRPLLEDGRRVAVFELDHFMQWGTPDDLAEYRAWSSAFRALVDPARARRPVSQRGTTMVPMAGLGSRFAQEGHTLPKPLIPVSGEPMVVQATLDLPAAERHVFVLRKDLPGLDAIETTLQARFPGSFAVELAEVTDGQARTCLLGLDATGLDSVDLDAPLTIGACDNGAIYDADALRAALDDNEADVLVWVARGYPGALRRPTHYGWVDEAGGTVRSVSVKVPLENPARDPIIVGTFTFKRARDFAAAAEAMIARDGRVNGEFYVDSCIEDAIALGLRCRVFDIEHYLCWGTPDDLRTFEYWQHCFHHWPSHPYRLELDSRVARTADVAPSPQPPIARTAASDSTRRIRPNTLFLPSTYFPTHEENRFQHEGDVARAREFFLQSRPRNLEYLLHKRYSWMNAHLQPGQRVVEFGAGSGLSKEFIRHEGFQITDVEPRPWTDAVADAMDPPFPPGSIDVAIFSHMIHHLPSPAKFFASVHRMLAPNGLVLIQELNTCFALKAALRAMRHEGWSYDIDVFDPDIVANDPRDPWSANCAIPELLFTDAAEFERRIPGFAIEKNALNECFVFLASGGVVVRAKTVELPRFALRAIDALDSALVKMMPSVFAMGRSVVLRKIGGD
jgi:NDP-sugar pyrophosphorylase family protein/SAM-dependent methyltransferase